jgi:Membrane bound O-acyl transferase family
MFFYNGTTAPSHRELMRIYQAALDVRVKAGEIRPLLLPHDGYGLFALLIYLCIPHVNRPWLYAARWPLLAFIVVFDLNLIRGTSSMYVGAGFGVGLIAAWGIVWSATWLVWNAPQFDAKRVQRKEDKRPSTAVSPQAMDVNPQVSSKIKGLSNGKANGKAAKNGAGLRQRQGQNGHIKAEKQENGQEDIKATTEEEAKEPAQYEYYWQSYPTDSLRDRIDWVSDLIFNFRGPGWNWEVPSNPSLPAHVKVGLGEPVDIKSMQIKSSTGIKRFISHSELLRAQIPRSIFGYLLLDALKVILMKDPYFTLGPNDLPLPPHLSGLSPTTITMIHAALSLLAIITAIETIFLLPPLFFCLILGPDVLNARGEFWQYPTTWGSFENVTRKGLQGLWGGWWHQTFRYAFTAPTNFLIKHGILKPKSQAAKLFGGVVAFGISGFLHASGSYTQIPDTIPMNLILFFMLQVVGIMVQSSFCDCFKAWIRKLPVTTRTAGNFAFTFTWLYCTAPLLIDDFARGGVWLFQPVPISPLRALGYGEPGDGWWCLEDIRISWYTGKHWWERGLAL